MKTFILLFSVVVLQLNSFAQSSMLQDYLAVKDALVAGKPELATAGAQKLSKSIQSQEPNSLPANEEKLFTQQKSKLAGLAESIAIANDLEKQRNKFAELSVILWPIVKRSAKSGQPLFYDYCPMKKMYWISAEQAIRNPYYGSKMLTCGSIAEKSKQ